MLLCRVSFCSVVVLGVDMPSVILQCNSAGCCYAKCHFAKYVSMLSVVMLSVITDLGIFTFRIWPAALQHQQ